MEFSLPHCSSNFNTQTCCWCAVAKPANGNGRCPSLLTDSPEPGLHCSLAGFSLQVYLNVAWLLALRSLMFAGELRAELLNSFSSA